MEEKLITLLRQNGYIDIQFDYQDDNEFFFEGFSDATVEIRVDVDQEKNTVSIYDRYPEDKHFAYMKTCNLSEVEGAA